MQGTTYCSTSSKQILLPLQSSGWKLCVSQTPPFPTDQTYCSRVRNSLFFLFQSRAAELIMLCISGKRYYNSIIVREGCPSLWVEAFRNLDYCTGNKRDCFRSYLHFIMKLLLGNTGNQGVCPPCNPRILYLHCTSETKHKKMRCFCSQISSFMGIHHESMTKSKTKSM